MRHDTAVAIGQTLTPTDTTEVTQISALLDPVDITGMTVTADAAHPSVKTATYLLDRGAGYVFTVKPTSRASTRGSATGYRSRLRASIRPRLPRRLTSVPDPPRHLQPVPPARQQRPHRRRHHAHQPRRRGRRARPTPLGHRSNIHRVRDVLLREDHHHAVGRH
ncbi:transposase [Pilimelia columellifera]|uniref:transposase n=1 Tax=Pilimelia columellifera TaxID=706574 RepID=UPI003CD0B4F4